jgi:hypothetical protein
VRNVVQRIERSQTIVANREAVAYSLLTEWLTPRLQTSLSGTTWAMCKVKASSRIPEHALQSIKSIKSRVDRNGEATIELELYDKVQILRILGQGIWLYWITLMTGKNRLLLV